MATAALSLTLYFRSMPFIAKNSSEQVSGPTPGKYVNTKSKFNSFEITNYGTINFGEGQEIKYEIMNGYVRISSPFYATGYKIDGNLLVHGTDTYKLETERK